MPKDSTLPSFEDPRIQAEQWNIQNNQTPPLYRLRVTPQETAKAWIVFLPGLGDFVERYLDWFLLLADWGFGVIAPDWPGHGRSKGRRGDIATIKEVDLIIDACRHSVEARHGSVPFAIWGHSMGARFAIRQLSRGSLSWQWAWLSSPLLLPSLHNKGIKKTCLPLLAKLFPSLPLDTGVRTQALQANVSSPISSSLWHHSVSARLGMTLLKEEAQLRLQSSRIGRNFPIFITQGEDDTICPATLINDWITQQEERDLQIHYLLLKASLHEPCFEEAHKQTITTNLKNWLHSLQNPSETTANSN